MAADVIEAAGAKCSWTTDIVGMAVGVVAATDESGVTDPTSVTGILGGKLEASSSVELACAEVAVWAEWISMAGRAQTGVTSFVILGVEGLVSVG